MPPNPSQPDPSQPNPSQPSIEELDYRLTALGELVLRRRRPPSMPDTFVYEVKLAGRFLMSSLVQASEVALAQLALQRLHGSGWRVLVGGLGLGCTAAAALDWPQTATLEVVELLPEVIEWHRRGLVPLAARLLGDPRATLRCDDCFAWLRTAAAGSYDAVLIDIDDSPAEPLDPAHAWFYSVEGLRHARRCLQAGGMFALWTSRPCDDELRARIAAAFGNAEAEAVVFHNPLLGEDETNVIYLAQA